MKNITAILFDLDGTLVDTQELIVTSMRHTTQTVLKKTIPDEQLMEKIGTPLSTQMWDYTDDPETHAELLDVYREHNAAYHDELAKPFEGVRELLEKLKDAGYSLGVVTSKRHGPAVNGLQLAGIEGYMQCIVGADDCEAHKPLPDPVLQGAELLNVAPKNCLYIGDSPYDIAAGNAAGTTTIAVLWGMFSEEVLRAENPDYVCENPEDIAKLLSL